MPKSISNIRFQFWLVVLSVALFAVKIAAYLYTHSNTILSDALEGVVNIVASLLGLYSLYLASVPKDENHPYGHGKVEFLTAGFEGTLILIAGASIVVKAIHDYFSPNSVQNLTEGIYLITFAGILNYVAGYMAKQKGKELKSIVLYSSGKHLLSDAYTTLALLIGLALIHLTGIDKLDNPVAALFGLYIIYSGYSIIRKSIAGIMDEADFEIIEPIVQTLNEAKHDNWIDIHNFRIIQYGSQLHVDCHLTLPYYFDVEQAHDETEELNDELNKATNSKVELFVHIDPCNSESCRFCPLQACSVRKKPFEKRLDWELTNMVKNQKHAYQNH